MGKYGSAAPGYFDSGIGYPIPAVDKLIVVTEVTGRSGAPTRDQIKKWTQDYPDHNVALRLRRGVIALDIDAYKGDLDRLRQLETKNGKLPTTWNSDCRGGSGGKLLFQVPDNIKWKSNIDGITICQYTHRYIMVYPSYNHDSRSIYQWYLGLNGTNISEFHIPDIYDIPWLQDNWISELQLGDLDTYLSKRTQIYYNRTYSSRDLDLSYVPDELLVNDEQCRYMQHLLEEWLPKLEAYNNVHDVGLSAVAAVVGAGRAGHRGLAAALKMIFETFVSAPRNRDLTNEFHSILDFIVAQDDSIQDECVCDCKLNFVEIPHSSKEKIIRQSIEKLKNKAGGRCKRTFSMISIMDSGYVHYGVRDCGGWACLVCGPRRLLQILQFLENLDGDLYIAVVDSRTNKYARDVLSRKKCPRFNISLKDGGLITITSTQINGRRFSTKPVSLLDLFEKLIGVELSNIGQLNQTIWKLPKEIQSESRSLFTVPNVGKHELEVFEQCGASPGTYVKGDIKAVIELIKEIFSDIKLRL